MTSTTTRPTATPETVSYNTDTIRSVAGQIVAKVSTALETHTTAWNTIQTYLAGDVRWSSSFNGHVTTGDGQGMPDVYYYLRNVLEAHEKRLHASFDFQTGVANALYDLADQIDAAEELIANGFHTSTTTNETGSKTGKQFN